MKLKGIKHGQTIKLAENPGIPDDSQVVVEIKEVEGMNIETRLQKMKEFLATPWEGKEEFLEIMTEIDKERHAYRGREDNHLNE